MRFIESILFRDGEYHNLDLHQQRLDRTFEAFMPHIASHRLERVLPPLKMEGTYKVRLVYDADSEDADFDLEFVEYLPRKLTSLQVVHAKPFDYAFKYEDRRIIDRLTKQGTADDIIIAVDNQITDGSYFNLAFWDGENWVTPKSPLLNGVRRQQLIRDNQLIERPIEVHDLPSFDKVSLINAMLDLEELEVDLANVSW
ncbi:MAG: hypothetical protein Tsb0034_15260 [Ekhidna sp.]